MDFLYENYFFIHVLFCFLYDITGNMSDNAIL